MKVTLSKTTHYGLEVYRLYIDGSMIGEFLSESMARTAWLRIKAKVSK